MSAMKRAPNGYIIRAEFYTDEEWRRYLKRAMARRRDYRPLAVVMAETAAA